MRAAAVLIPCLLMALACGGGADEESGIFVRDVVVDDDTNRDGVPNPGERLALELTLESAESWDIEGATLELTTDDPEVTLEDPGPREFNGTWSPEEQSLSTWVLEIAPTRGTDEPVQFAVSVEAEGGHSWSDSFSLAVEPTGAEPRFVGYYVSNDTNLDEVINRGESLTFYVEIENAGTSNLTDLEASLTIDDPYITRETDNPRDVASTLQPGEVASESWGLKISADAPAEFAAPCELLLFDELGNSWTERFDLVVLPTAGDLIISEFYPRADNNDDGTANPGESFELWVGVENVGASRFVSPDASLFTESPYVTIDTTNPRGYDTLDPAESDLTNWKIHLSSTAPEGEPVVFELELVDAHNNTWSRSFSLPVEATQAEVKFSSYSVSSDSDGDNVPEAGETVSLDVYLENIGSSDAVASLNTAVDETYLTVTDTTARSVAGRLDPGEEDSALDHQALTGDPPRSTRAPSI